MTAGVLDVLIAGKLAGTLSQDGAGSLSFAYERGLDWQPFLGHFSQRLRPAFRNSTGLMYPSVECIRSLLYHHT